MLLRRYHEKAEVIVEEIKEPTKKELKALLDEKSIKYDSKANKEELIKLLEGAE